MVLKKDRGFDRLSPNGVQASPAFKADRSAARPHA
jgi:hypothetical protein